MRLRQILVTGLAHLAGLLVVLAAIFLQVAPRADDVLELVTDDHAGPLGAGAAVEEHDAGTGVGEGCLGGGGGGGGRQRIQSWGGRNSSCKANFARGLVRCCCRSAYAIDHALTDAGGAFGMIFFLEGNSGNGTDLKQSYG